VGGLDPFSQRGKDGCWVVGRVEENVCGGRGDSKSGRDRLSTDICKGKEKVITVAE